MKILQISFILLLCFSLLNLSEPAYAQVSTVQRDIATYQADWYGIEFTQPANWTLFLSHYYPVDDMAILLYDQNLSDVYNPEEEFNAVAGGRNFFFSNSLLLDYTNVPPGHYTLAVVAFDIVTDDTTLYTLESNSNLDFIGTTYFVDISAEGLNSVYSANVTWDFLGKTHTEEVIDSWFMWVDESSTLTLDKTIMVDSVERLHSGEDVRFTIVQAEELEIYYFHQYLSTIRTSGIENNIPLELSFTSAGEIHTASFINLWSDWVDERRSVALPRIIDVSSNERFITTNDVIIQTNQPVDTLIEYHHQWLVSITHNVDRSIPVTYHYFGDEIHKLIDNNLNLWLDDNSDFIVSPIIQSTEDDQRFVTNTNSWSVNSNPIIIEYSHQVKPTVIIRGLLDNYPTTIKYQIQGIQKIASSSSAWSEWVDYGSSLQIENEVYGKPGEKWLTYDSTAEILYSPLVVSVTYSRLMTISIAFTDAEGKILLPDKPSLIEIVDVTGTLITLNSFSDIWVPDGIIRLNNVKYQGSDYLPVDALNFVPEPGKTWTIPLDLYNLSFEVVDSIGYPIENATVILTMSNNLKISQLTDLHGTVTFELIPLGSYTARVSHMNFSDEINGYVDNDSGNVVSLIVLLSTKVVLASIVIFLVTLMLFISYTKTGKTIQQTLKNTVQDSSKKK